MKNSLLRLFFTILPKNLTSRLAGAFADSRLSRPFIAPFARRYRINLEEAQHPISHYPTLNAFFTRHLKEGRRPIAAAQDPQGLCSPVDGRVAQCGPISEGRLIQCKGRLYTLTDLIGDSTEAQAYQDGYFATIYLAPTDYHRIHHFTDGSVTGGRYLPGKLFPVNLWSVQNVENLFGINERLTTYLRGPSGQACAIIKVGATIVGRTKVTYSSVQTNSGKGGPISIPAPLSVRRGDELGLFEMGSTVILLFSKDSFSPEPGFRPDAVMRMGQLIGRWC